MEQRDLIKEIKIQTFALLIQGLAGENPTEEKIARAEELAQRFYAAGQRLVARA